MEPRPWGNVISGLRKRAAITQGELAKRAGMSRCQVTRIERGQRKVTADELIELSKALGFTVEQLQELRKTS